MTEQVKLKATRWLKPGDHYAVMPVSIQAYSVWVESINHNHDPYYVNHGICRKCAGQIKHHGMVLCKPFDEICVVCPGDWIVEEDGDVTDVLCAKVKG